MREVTLIIALLVVGASAVLFAELPAAAQSTLGCPFLAPAAGLPFDSSTTTQFIEHRQTAQARRAYLCTVNFGKYWFEIGYFPRIAQRHAPPLPRGTHANLARLQDPGYKAWSESWGTKKLHAEMVEVFNRSGRTSLKVIEVGTDAALPFLNRQEAIAIGNAVLKAGLHAPGMDQSERKYSLQGG